MSFLWRLHATKLPIWPNRAWAHKQRLRNELKCLNLVNVVRVQRLHAGRLTATRQNNWPAGRNSMNKYFSDFMSQPPPRIACDVRCVRYWPFLPRGREVVSRQHPRAVRAGAINYPTPNGEHRTLWEENVNCHKNWPKRWRVGRDWWEARICEREGSCYIEVRGYRLGILLRSVWCPLEM